MTRNKFNKAGTLINKNPKKFPFIYHYIYKKKILKYYTFVSVQYVK